MSGVPLRSLPAAVVEPIVDLALTEDLGRGGDLTSDSVIPETTWGTADLVIREAGCVAGLEVAFLTFDRVDDRIEIADMVNDGAVVEAGTVAARLRGPLRSILAAERVALNFVGHLSGVATATRRLVDAVAGTSARIVDTRKTTPGLRALEKYAVRAGGGSNHRLGLDDAVLIKDNHLVAAGSVREAVERARAQVGHLVRIEVEVDTLEQLQEALDCGVEVVLLDNMGPSRLAEAVRLVDGRAVTEASGGITEATVRPVAESGVDCISVGWITHSAPSLDVALDVVSG